MKRTFKFRVVGKTMMLKGMPGSKHESLGLPKEMSLMGKLYKVRYG